MPAGQVKTRAAERRLGRAIEAEREDVNAAFAAVEFDDVAVSHS
jgi:hypothetical protein